MEAGITVEVCELEYDRLIVSEIVPAEMLCLMLMKYVWLWEIHLKPRIRTFCSTKLIRLFLTISVAATSVIVLYCSKLLKKFLRVPVMVPFNGKIVREVAESAVYH